MSAGKCLMKKVQRKVFERDGFTKIVKRKVAQNSVV